MERIFSVAILLGALSGPSAVWAQSYYPQSSVDVIKIGGLFDGDDTVEEAAFKHAVERFNMESRQTGPLRFSSQIERMPKNSYLASPKVCRMMREGVAAIFGPQSDQAASHVQSICDAFEMPHIETKWDYKIRKENYLINLHPHPATLSRAYSDLVDAFHWDSYAIIYEDEDSLYKLQDLIKGIAPPKRQALLRLMPPSLDLRSIYREILRETDITKIVLDCDARKLGSALKQAQQVGLMTYKFSFIITSLDFHTLDLDDFKFAEANITALRLIDPERPELQQVMREWAAMSGPTNEYSSLIHPTSSRSNYGGSNNNNNGYYQDTSAMFSRYVSGFSYEQSQTVVPMRTDIALIYDAVQLLGKALNTLNQTIDVKSLDCESSDFSRHGYSVINYMKNDLMQGITGWIHFNTTGFRTDVSLDVVQLKEQGITRIGVWDSKFIHKFNWTRPSSPDQPIDEGLMELRNRTLRVTTIMTDPMVMWTRSEVPLAGNARYEGFSVDLLQRLSERIGFKYVIIPVADGKYGKPNANGEWNGMVGEVINGVADVAVADLTINKQRQDAVDFTMPFMNLGISILYVVPSKKPPSLFSFLLPFSKDVWVYMAFAFFGVSLILFILARITPYEWDNPHPCIEDPDELENQFTLLNSFWFTIGSIMQQGSDIAPKAVSTRMIAGIWWFFTLIMVSSYTANLATFLIVQDLDESIKSLDDLPKQTKAKYGCVGQGTTCGFFQNAPFPLHQQIWKNMETMNKKHKVFARSNAEGVGRVVKEGGGYAFFMESTAIEYNVERNCILAQVGGLLDNKGYGIALKKGSRFRQAFSSGILKLQEDGVLDELKRKWWKEQRKDNVCADSGSSDSVDALRLANVGGVFVVLIGGCIMAIVFAFLEFFWKSRELAADDGVSVVYEMLEELKFALACRGNVKQVRKKSSLSSQTNGSESNKGSKGSSNYLDSAT